MDSIVVYNIKGYGLWFEPHSIFYVLLNILFFKTVVKNRTSPVRDVPWAVLGHSLLYLRKPKRSGFFKAVLASLPPFRPRPGNPTGASLSSSGDS
jgi:hypothetical protein